MLQGHPLSWQASFDPQLSPAVEILDILRKPDKVPGRSLSTVLRADTLDVRNFCLSQGRVRALGHLYFKRCTLVHR